MSFFFLIDLFLAVLDLSCCVLAFSGSGEWGLLSSCGAWTSHCGGFLCCRANVLECADFSSCSRWALENGFRSCDA